MFTIILCLTWIYHPRVKELIIISRVCIWNFFPRVCVNSSISESLHTMIGFVFLTTGVRYMSSFKIYIVSDIIFEIQFLKSDTSECHFTLQNCKSSVILISFSKLGCTCPRHVLRVLRCPHFTINMTILQDTITSTMFGSCVLCALTHISTATP